MYVVNFYTSELLPHVFKGAILTFFNGGSNLPKTTLYVKWIWDIKPADYGV